MKTCTLLLLVCFMLLCSLSYSQANLQETTNTKQQIPLITKGYYSIYNNAEKLKFTTPTDSIIQAYNLPVTKGYYSIKYNSDKISSKRMTLGNIRNTTLRKLPVRDVKKGYFSIGKNIEKL